MREIISAPQNEPCERLQHFSATDFPVRLAHLFESSPSTLVDAGKQKVSKGSTDCDNLTRN